jgi:hypothetical protein
MGKTVAVNDGSGAGSSWLRITADGAFCWIGIYN